MDDGRYEQYRRALGERALPAAFVDLSAFDANVEALLRRTGDVPIRLVTKSIRCVALLRRAQAASPRFRGLLCYDPREAVWLAGQGFDDLLVAYPSVNPSAITAVCAAIAAGARITLMVDSVEHIERLQAIASTQAVRLPVCLDLDMSTALPGLWFGVRRSPLRRAAQVLALWRQIERCGHLTLEGVMGYEAQISGLADADPARRLRSALIRALKRLSAARLVRRRGRMVTALRRAGAELKFVNGGGSGSLAVTAADASVTEISAGSALFAPASFDHVRGFDFQPAAGFALEASRRPTSGMITCNGGGYIASGSAGQPPQPWLPVGLSLTSHEGAGEVQTPLSGAVGIELGAPVMFRHAKAGELCERFNELLLLEGGRLVDVAPTYRGAGQGFL